MAADGGPPTPVTTYPESGLFIEEPTISPDGRWLVYNVAVADPRCGC